MFGALKNRLASFVKRVAGREEEPEETAKEDLVRDAEKLVPPAPKQAEAEKGPFVESVRPKAFAEEVVKEQQREHEPEPEFRTGFEDSAETERVLPAPPEPAKRVEGEIVGQRERGTTPAFELREEKRQLTPRVGILKKVSGIFSGSVTITEEETSDLFEELEVSLLESDVSFDTAQFLVDDLRKRLIGKKVPQNAVSESVASEVRNALIDVASLPSYDFFERVNQKKPFVVLFFGPIGGGKTTTIAKLAYHLSKRGKKSVIAASDTFRAAAIQQAQEHGERLGVKVVKHDYGADPSAVAFDAIAHARAQGVDVVLVDTAGRQETNTNLIREMEKMNRVIKPDLKLFVGEATSGHALVEQARKLGEAVGGLDGVILTKIDCDAKGGNTFSIAHELKTPILFLGTGQDYEDLKPFNPGWLVDNIIPAA